MAGPREAARFVGEHSPPLDEAFVAWVWETCSVSGGALQLADGSALRVVFGGRHWGGAGPDFRGALLERPDGTLIRGDVEVHLHAADWKAHGHGRDAEYNSVVLHVALDGGPEGARLQDGRIIPTAIIGLQLGSTFGALRARFAASGGQAARGPACVHDAAQAGALLDAAGLARFHERAARLEGDLACQSAEQVLYRELLAAMGYSTNQAACRRLADVVPYDELEAETVSRAFERRVDVARALLFGHGGLLPSEPVAVPGGILREWAALDEGTPRLPSGIWRRRTTRPDNSPARRIAGLGAWLAPRMGDGWVEDLAQAVRSGAGSKSSAALTELFRVRAKDDFWPYHFGFGCPTAGLRPWLIGRGRAMEIVVSVLLPSAYALGQAWGDDTLSAAALRCYQRFPATPGNRVVRHMAEQVAGGAARQVRMNACRQQGLLHLFREWCAERRCLTCPAGGGKSLVVLG